MIPLRALSVLASRIPTALGWSADPMDLVQPFLPNKPKDFFREQLSMKVRPTLYSPPTYKPPTAQKN